MEVRHLAKGRKHSIWQSVDTKVNIKKSAANLAHPFGRDPESQLRLVVLHCCSADAAPRQRPKLELHATAPLHEDLNWRSIPERKGWLSLWLPGRSWVETESTIERCAWPESKTKSQTVCLTLSSAWSPRFACLLLHHLRAAGSLQPLFQPIPSRCQQHRYIISFTRAIDAPRLSSSSPLGIYEAATSTPRSQPVSALFAPSCRLSVVVLRTTAALRHAACPVPDTVQMTISRHSPALRALPDGEISNTMVTARQGLDLFLARKSL